MGNLILASGSPRRKELLELVGIPFEVRSPDVDESVLSLEDPRQLVEQLAKLKGDAVDLKEGDVVLSADTVVSYYNRVLTKPTDRNDAVRMLMDLNGQEHNVYTGVMIKSKEKETTFSVMTTVQFWSVSNKEIEDYVASGDPMDKAGSYGIQSNGAFLVKQIIGDYYNVVGLPVSTVIRKLREFNIFPK